MVELGFIHGRFQLFHNDHLQYALLAKERCKRLIVGITSPENAALIREDVDPHRSEAASNPFTYFERYNMVKLALLEKGIPFDHLVASVRFLRLHRCRLFHRINGNTVIGEYTVAGVVVCPFLCIGKEAVCTDLAPAVAPAESYPI